MCTPSLFISMLSDDRLGFEKKTPKKKKENL